MSETSERLAVRNTTPRPSTSPTGTWRLGSYVPVERRRSEPDGARDRRQPERRWGARRALRSLLRL